MLSTNVNLNMFAYVLPFLSLISILSLVRCNEVRVTNSQVAVSTGDTFEVRCSVDNELKGCYMKTPQNQILMIFHGVKYQNNRIIQNGNFVNECGIRVHNATPDTDHGRWECGLSVVSDGKSISISNHVEVWILSPPSTVKLNSTVPLYQVSDSSKALIDVESESSFKCIATSVYPRPRFVWFLGKYLLNTTKIPCPLTDNNKNNEHTCVTNAAKDNFGEDGSNANSKTQHLTRESLIQRNWNILDHTQSLVYRPGVFHNGKSLRCVTIHQTFNESKTYYYDSNRISLDVRYAPFVISEKIKEPKEGLSVVRINFKSNPTPNSLFWTLPNGEVLKIGGRSTDQKFASGVIQPISSRLLDEWMIELWIDVNSDENRQLQAWITIANDFGSTSHDFDISTSHSFWTMPILIAVSMGGILFLVGLIVILIFLITQKIQDIDSTASNSDSEESISFKCDDNKECG